MSKTAKISDLIACYQELASGESVEVLYQKYVRVDVIVALELFDRGITVNELDEFIQSRNAHLAKLTRVRL